MELVEMFDGDHFNEELIVEQARKGDARAQELLIKKYKNFEKNSQTKRF